MWGFFFLGGEGDSIPCSWNIAENEKEFRCILYDRWMNELMKNTSWLLNNFFYDNSLFLLNIYFLNTKIAFLIT